MAHQRRGATDGSDAGNPNDDSSSSTSKYDEGDDEHPSSSGRKLHFYNPAATVFNMAQANFNKLNIDIPSVVKRTANSATRLAKDVAQATIGTGIGLTLKVADAVGYLFVTRFAHTHPLIDRYM